MDEARALIDGGTDVDTERYRRPWYSFQRDGSTALHDVVMSGSVEIARLLIDAGAVIDATNKVR